MVRILCVDDDAVMRKTLSVMLRRLDFEVDVAPDAVTGIEMWGNGNYDLVLMDVQMPHMDGLEATRAIRAQEREHGGHVPIIAVTAHALKKDEERCLAAGMDAFIPKPIDFRRCVSTIRSFVAGTAPGAG